MIKFFYKISAGFWYSLTLNKTKDLLYTYSFLFYSMLYLHLSVSCMHILALVFILINIQRIYLVWVQSIYKIGNTRFDEIWQKKKLSDKTSICMQVKLIFRRKIKIEILNLCIPKQIFVIFFHAITLLPKMSLRTIHLA